MILVDPDWDENERLAYEADWQEWCEFSGDTGLPADPQIFSKFVERQIDFGSEKIVRRRLQVIRRIHELNGFADPLADLGEDGLVWRLLAKRGPDSAVGFVGRALTDAEWSILRSGQVWEARRSLTLNGVDAPEIERWYDWIIKSPPPLSSLQLGDNYGSYYELGDPSAAITAISGTLKYLHICGTAALDRPLNLKLSILILKGTFTLPDGWFERSAISAETVNLAVEGIDATRYLPILMNPELDSIEISDARNVGAMLAALFTRPKAPSYLQVQCPYGDDALSGGQLAYDALIGADASWKRCDICVPFELFDVDMIDDLGDAGYQVIED